jgi:hypothetical protein
MVSLTGIRAGEKVMRQSSGNISKQSSFAPTKTKYVMLLSVPLVFIDFACVRAAHADRLAFQRDF